MINPTGQLTGGSPGLRQLDHLLTKLRRIRRLEMGHVGLLLVEQYGVREMGSTPNELVRKRLRQFEPRLYFLASVLEMVV